MGGKAHVLLQNALRTVLTRSKDESHLQKVQSFTGSKSYYRIALHQAKHAWKITGQQATQGAPRYADMCS